LAEDVENWFSRANQMQGHEGTGDFSGDLSAEQGIELREIERDSMEP
jgi:hypothetical protein